jgi:uncharacterized SAM-binding protein YcdF (DUF218 family)
MPTDLQNAAQMVWDFHHMQHQLAPADAILVLGSHDTRVAERAVDIWEANLAPRLIFSGGLGRLTEGLWDQSEAELFRDIALERGVPEEKILVENQSTNSGENFRFTEQLLRNRNLFDRLQSFIVVQKPYMERRAYATFKKHWSNKKCRVTSPLLSFSEYCESPHPEINRETVTHLMVGDLQRLWIYAERGYQIPMSIPDEVIQAYEKLVDAGYTNHIVSE